MKRSQFAEKRTQNVQFLGASSLLQDSLRTLLENDSGIEVMSHRMR